MDAVTIISLILSEEEQEIYKNLNFGITEMDAYKFLYENRYCRFYDWKEGIENISNIISFVQERTLKLRGKTLSISPNELIKKYSMSPLFRHKGGWMQYILYEMFQILQCHQLYLVNWNKLDDGYRIVITTKSKVLSLCNSSLDEGHFYILKDSF